MKINIIHNSRTQARGFWAVGMAACLSLMPSICPAADWSTFLGSPARGAHVVKEKLQANINLLWVRELPGTLEASPVIAGGIVHQGSCDGNLYALNAADGSLKWKFKAGGVLISTPALDAKTGLAIFGCNNNQVYAVRAKDGTLAWRHTTAPPSPHVILHGNQVKASPALVDGRALLGNYSGQWLSLPVTGGKPHWSAKGQLTFASPASDDRRVVMADLAGITCLALADGKVLWQRKQLGAFLASPSIRDGTVYVASAGDLAGQSRRFTIGILPNTQRMAPGPLVPVVSLNLETGHTNWLKKVPDSVIASPAVTDQLVIVGDTRGQVTALDRRNGTIRWRFQTGHGIWASPAATGDEVIVASTDGWLYRLRLRDGGLVWKFNTGSPLYASPAVAGGRIYAANESGYVMAFGAGSAAKHPLNAREPRDLDWARSQPSHNSFWDLTGRVESFKSAPMNTWALETKGARYRRERGELMDFLMRFRVESGGGKRHDLNLSNIVEIKNGQVITVCSRPPTTYNRLHVSPTQADWPVNWTKQPRVRMICTLENPFNPLVPKGTRPFCTYLVQVQPAGADTPPAKHWPIWHHNNWIHFTTQLEETGHAAALGGLGLDFVGWGLCDERVYPRYYTSRWWREMRLRLYTQRTVDFYRVARQPVTGRWRALPLHTPGVFPGDPRDDSARQNRPPQCRIRADRLRGKAPLRVQFRAEAQDPGGRIAWQTWDFDASDGVAVDSAKAAPAWEFIKPGRYTVSLTVMDNFLSPAHTHVVVTVEP